MGDVQDCVDVSWLQVAEPIAERGRRPCNHFDSLLFGSSVELRRTRQLAAEIGADEQLLAAPGDPLLRRQGGMVIGAAICLRRLLAALTNLAPIDDQILIVVVALDTDLVECLHAQLHHTVTPISPSPLWQAAQVCNQPYLDTMQAAEERPSNPLICKILPAHG